MQLCIFHQIANMVLEGTAAVPLRRLGQEAEFAQWPLWPQLKHLSKSIGRPSRSTFTWWLPGACIARSSRQITTLPLTNLCQCLSFGWTKFLFILKILRRLIRFVLLNSCPARGTLLCKTNTCLCRFDFGNCSWKVSFWDVLDSPVH